jgi:hypothetical protein
VNVDDRELHGRTTRRFARPEEKILLLALLEEQEVVARPLETQVIDDGLDLLTVDLVLLLDVGDQRSDIFDQVEESSSDASRDENKSALPILPLLGKWLGILEGAEFLL